LNAISRAKTRKDRVDEIYTRLSFLGDMDDLINNHTFQIETRYGKRIEIKADSRDTVRMGIYEEDSDTLIDEIEVKVLEDEDGIWNIAEALYDVVEKRLGDKIEEIVLLGWK